MAKRYEELTIADDFMFGKVMEDKKLCREVLECLLDHSVGELEEVQTERQFRYTTDGKPVRLDVYTRDQNHIYDAEMQNLNHQAAEKLELPRRIRGCACGMARRKFFITVSAAPKRCRSI